jgi:hypothetical protein
VVDVTHHPVYAAAAPDGSTSSAPRTSVAPAAEESRATATLQRSQQPSSQPLSKMQRIIASYRQPNPSSFPTAALTAPAAAAGNGNTAPSAQELQNVGVAQVETTPLREPPVLLQPTNAAPEAVGTAKKSAFVF